MKEWRRGTGAIEDQNKKAEERREENMEKIYTLFDLFPISFLQVRETDSDSSWESDDLWAIFPIYEGKRNKHRDCNAKAPESSLEGERERD